MKIKNGFISNSSSSSFIIGCKEKPTKETLLKIFKVSEDSPLYTFTKDIIDFIISDIKEEKPDTEDDLEKEIINKDWKLFRGFASDDSEEYSENALCYMELNYKDENIIISKGAGY